MTDPDPILNHDEEKKREETARLASFKARMRALEERERAAEKLAADKLRSDYLARTGRSEMKP